MMVLGQMSASARGPGRLRELRPGIPWTAVRYFLLRTLTFFLAIESVAAALYIIVDWFERSPYFLKNDVAVATMVAYYLLKLPLILSQTLAPACVAAVVFSLALSNRAGEILALRAAGCSPFALFGPIAAVMFGLSMFLLLWNETIVPPTASRAQQINLAQIKLRDRKSVLAEQEVWLRGRLGFYHVGMVDRRRKTLLGLTVYAIDEQFRLQHILFVPSLDWLGKEWNLAAAKILTLPGGQARPETDAPQLLASLEPFDNFVELQRETEELSFRELRDQIARLQARGIDTSYLLPELHLKLAVPFVPLVLSLVLTPLSAAQQFRKRTHWIILAATLAGFVYWLLLSLAQSLPAHTPVRAAVLAWAPNASFLLLALALSAKLR